MCKGPLPLLFDSMSVEAGVAMTKEVILYEDQHWRLLLLRLLWTLLPLSRQLRRMCSRSARRPRFRTKLKCHLDVDQPDDHRIGEQPKVRGSRQAPQKRLAADLVVSNAEFSRLANVEEIHCWVQGVAWHMWAPILYLKRQHPRDQAERYCDVQPARSTT